MDSRQQSETFQLWDQLADFGAGNAAKALKHLMEVMARRMAADDILWVGAVRIAQSAKARRDPLRGWRVRTFQHLRERAELENNSSDAMREQEVDPGMTTRAMADSAGTFRVHRLRDGFVDYAAFKRTAHYRKYYLDPGLQDRMWAAFPVSPDSESVFVADIYHPRGRFSDDDVSLFGGMLRGLKWFHRQLFLAQGLHQIDTPLPPSQRRVLNCLLSELSEKQIAAKLGLTPGTTHQYAVEIYRRFGVNGRAGLMALWLGG